MRFLFSNSKTGWSPILWIVVDSDDRGVVHRNRSRNSDHRNRNQRSETQLLAPTSSQRLQFNPGQDNTKNSDCFINLRKFILFEQLYTFFCTVTKWNHCSIEPLTLYFYRHSSLFYSFRANYNSELFHKEKLQNRRKSYQRNLV